MNRETDEREPGPVERELTELREREASYRARLAETAALSRRLRVHTNAVLELLRRPPAREHDSTRTLADVARISGEALGVARTSIWLFTDKTELTCKLLLTQGRAEPTEGISIATSVSPAYFRTIDKTGVVAVENVFADARTVGLEPYLQAHGVQALLDISIAIPGELIGVICHEHTTGQRVWQPEEIDFATHIADLVALMLEVDRRRRAEAKALGTEAKYRYLVESLPVTVYSFDAHSNRLEYLSPQIHEFGSIGNKMLTTGVAAWLDTIHPEDRARVEARFSRGGVDASPAEIHYRLVLPNGEERHVRDLCRVVRNHAGEPLAIQGVLADVSDQHRAEVRSAELERRFQALLQHVDLIALVLDCDGRTEFVNECFERVTGYKAEELLGVDCFALLVPATEADGVRERFLRDVRRRSIVPRFENEIRTRSGERRRIVWTNTLLRTGDGSPEGTCSLGLDITDRVRLETELLQQTKLESLGQLSAGVAHDFNNLLTVMSVETERLALTHRDAGSQGSLALVQQSLRQAAELTRSLLVYARRQPVFPTRVEVDQLIEDATPLLMAFANKEVELRVALHAPAAQVVMDQTQLRQLVINLVRNAVDAARDHGKHVRIDSYVEFRDEASARERGAARGGEFVVIQVADDGHGMDAHTLRRAFEPFFTTKEQGKGTGLGLSMCQSIATRAGGFLSVDSELGQGTTCRAFLPLQARDEVVADSQLMASHPKLVAGPIARTALVVEDEPAIRELVVRALEGLSLSVLAVGTAEAGARIAATEHIDLLVTDGNLPDGSGRILARSARAARPRIRVLLISGNPEDSAEFDATLQKPMTSAQLRAAVARLLDPGSQSG